MTDIFISYSRKDSEQATMLAEMLTSAGLSCWIDREGIDLATSWSREIVQGIDQCKAFVLLLSPSSNESHNVAKEVSLAAEQKKKILPLDLEPVTLSEELRYHLAGIQRAPMTNIDSIIRALTKLGLEATGAPHAPKIVKETDGRKSLMILPFHDLSPTADNGWFADGIANELIAALSNIKSLRVSDQQATKDYKRYTGTLPVYAKEMSIRYFIQGDIRKFGDQIKISSSLLDIETGDHLWQDSLKGTMEDIFDIQETVAKKVVEGLKVHLATDEKKKLSDRGTENAEAYELCLKASEYYLRQTKEGFELALQLNTEAILLDSNYAEPYIHKAIVLGLMYRDYDSNPQLLDEAESLCREALRRRPESIHAYIPLSTTSMYQGRLQEAEELLQEYIRQDPESGRGYSALAFFYGHTGQPAKAIGPLEQFVRLKPDLARYYNLLISCNAAGETEKCEQYALEVLPLYERHVRIHPDDESARVGYSVTLCLAGRLEDARRESRYLLNHAKDGASLYNAASTFCVLEDNPEAVECLRKAIQLGYTNVESMRHLMQDPIMLRGAETPACADVMRMIENITVKQNA